MNKRGQATLFIILGIIIVAGVFVFFAFKGSFSSSDVPESLQPVYNSFLSCVEEKTLLGISVLESQGGYINLPEFEVGSEYAPFGSQLDFLGNSIPYWYYVSGNNIQKEQVPSRKIMESELESFIEGKIKTCDFENYFSSGYMVNLGEAEVNVDIKDSQVDVNLDMDFGISKEDSVIISLHKIEVKSNLGKLYSAAIDIYDYEQQNLFLEEYGIDVLRLYAPVDGVELTCAPLTWNALDIFEELFNAIESNVAALKVKSGDFALQDKKDKYFVLDIDLDSDVRFLTSTNWPYRFEVNPSEGNLLVANPIGNQQGLGALGFCYVPYHFVYDLDYPVLVQVYSGEEIFQFPLAVVINGNVAREALESSALEIEDNDFCEYKNTEFLVNVYDTEYNPVEAKVSYECFGVSCDIGYVGSNGKLVEYFPQCVNGYLIIEADGYKTNKVVTTIVNEGSVDVFLDKEYEIDIELLIDGRKSSDEVILSFVSNFYSTSIIYPETNKVVLSSGQYEINAYSYKNSSLKIDATTTTQCVSVPQSGVGGLFGLEEEKCFDIEIPSQIISNALSAGGSENYYILESQLKDSSVLEIQVGSLPNPTSLEQLQENYILLEDKGLEVNFK